MDQGERDGGGRVDVSRGSVPEFLTLMSRRVPYHDAREVRLQGEAESAPQARNFQQNECRLRAENGP
jgi:hypothetical protein